MFRPGYSRYGERHELDEREYGRGKTGGNVGMTRSNPEFVKYMEGRRIFVTNLSFDT